MICIQKDFSVNRPIESRYDGPFRDQVRRTSMSTIHCSVFFLYSPVFQASAGVETHFTETSLYETF